MQFGTDLDPDEASAGFAQGGEAGEVFAMEMAEPVPGVAWIVTRIFPKVEAGIELCEGLDLRLTDRFVRHDFEITTPEETDILAEVR